ncbi:MAG: aldehyde dehydrogenase family protein [Candidatus Omnitrophota bacterium]
MLLHNNLFIDHKWIESKGGKKGKVLNPATNEVLGEITLADAPDVTLAVETASQAFEKGLWHKKPLLERSAILNRVGDLITKNAEELSQIETADVGKPITESRNIDIPSSADTFHYFANLMSDIGGEVIPSAIPDIMDYTVHEPLGVVAAITPWNFPFLIASRKLASALAAGNSVVIKPSSLAPFSTLRLMDLLTDAGVPEGVVNAITGSGGIIGEALTTLPQVQDISFTGSTEVGKTLMSCCSENLKGVGLELGGKSPALVLPDANLQETLDGILFGIFLNQGECCCAATRILVHKDIYDRFVPELVSATKALRVGLPREEKTQMGPLVSQEHLETVLNYIEDGKKAGARLLCGGNRLKKGVLNKGNFVSPAIFAEVSRDMRIFQEEIFGPVAVVTKCSGIEEMVALANDSIYGLAASIWTNNLKEGHRIASRLKSGTVWMNLHNFVMPMGPYGGYKMSGLGRELGREGVLALMQTKNVMVNLMEKPFKWY